MTSKGLHPQVLTIAPGSSRDVVYDVPGRNHTVRKTVDENQPRIPLVLQRRFVR